MNKWLILSSIATIAGCTAAQRETACSRFIAAENSPAVQAALGIGIAAANTQTAGVAGLVVSSIKSYGDAYCTKGPPVGDTTTAVQQESWLDNSVTAKLLKAAAGL